MRPSPSSSPRNRPKAGYAPAIWTFNLLHFAIGLSSAATFGPLMAEASHWFERRRGFAITLAASGNYVGGILGHVLERAAGDPEFQPARLTVDLFRPAALAPVRVDTTVTREGRRLRLVDAVMTRDRDVSVLFSFTRSYFHVDLERVGKAVLIWMNLSNFPSNLSRIGRF